MYKVGLELLDNKGQPLEHVAYEEFDDMEQAVNYYLSLETELYKTAKYLAKDNDVEFYVLQSEGYLTDDALCGATSYGIKHRQTKYMVEFNDIDDNDHQLLQSKWFDNEEDAIVWFNHTLDWFDRNRMVAWLMYSEFDEYDEYTDILFDREL